MHVWNLECVFQYSAFYTLMRWFFCFACALYCQIHLPWPFHCSVIGLIVKGKALLQRKDCRWSFCRTEICSHSCRGRRVTQGAILRGGRRRESEKQKREIGAKGFYRYWSWDGWDFFFFLICVPHHYAANPLVMPRHTWSLYISIYMSHGWDKHAYFTK